MLSGRKLNDWRRTSESSEKKLWKLKDRVTELEREKMDGPSGQQESVTPTVDKVPVTKKDVTYQAETVPISAAAVVSNEQDVEAVVAGHCGWWPQQV